MLRIGVFWRISWRRSGGKVEMIGREGMVYTTVSLSGRINKKSYKRERERGQQTQCPRNGAPIGKNRQEILQKRERAINTMPPRTTRKLKRKKKTTREPSP